MSEMKGVALGIIVDPPTLLLTYDLGKKRRQRRMPIRCFTDKSDVDKAIFILKQRHSPFLSSVLPLKIFKMLRIIQEIMKGLETKEAVKKIDEELEINPEQDLNKVSEKVLEQRKQAMDEIFLKKVIKPGDPDFVYDLQKNFDSVSKQKSEWDDEEDVQGDMILSKEEVIDENLLLSICEGDIDNIFSICDLDIQLPLGNEEDKSEISQSRNKMYLCDNNNETISTPKKEELKKDSYIIIDIVSPLIDNDLERKEEEIILSDAEEEECFKINVESPLVDKTKKKKEEVFPQDDKPEKEEEEESCKSGAGDESKKLVNESFLQVELFDDEFWT